MGGEYSTTGKRANGLSQMWPGPSGRTLAERALIDAVVPLGYVRPALSRVAKGYDKATAMVASQVNDGVLDAVGTGPALKQTFRMQTPRTSRFQPFRSLASSSARCRSTGI